MSLLPDPALLTLESICPQGNSITITARTKVDTVNCPDCSYASDRVHSRYRRTLTDLPWQDMPVRFVLTVRRFRCLNTECPRRIFTERIPSIAACHAQKTARLANILLQLAWLGGGRASAHIARLLGVVISPDAQLYHLKEAHKRRHPVTTPRVLGVDDFAFRRGHVYGTLLIDMERRCPIDLLPDRETETLQAWLLAHPEIEIISRDRSTAYAEAATKGAPEAVQVADRWHLAKNLADAITRFLDQHRSDLYKAAPLLRTSEGNLPVQWPPSKGAATDEYRRQQRDRRRTRYETVSLLYRKGLSMRRIARLTGLSRGTVQRYVQSGHFTETAPRTPRPTSLDPFKDYLQRRWLAGCRNASQLFREIQAQGFGGTCSWVSRYIHGLRVAAAEPIASQPIKPPSSRSITPLFLRRPEELSQSENAFLLCLRENPLMQNVYDLAQRFMTLLRQRQKGSLSCWREDARSSAITAIAGFSKGLEQDLPAVEAGLSLPWSNGPTEGQVNRLKLVKRSMYGRAGFDLLKARVLPLQTN